MKESIHIKEIGPLKDINIEDIKPFTVLIGESASGKSTLLKIIALFRYLYKKAMIRSWLRNGNLKGTYFRIQMNSYWKRSGMIEMLTSLSSVNYVVEMNGHRYEISYEKKKLSSLPDITDDDLVFFKISFISENRNVIPAWSEYGASNKNSKLGFYFHETYNDFDDATNVLKDIPLSHLSMHLNIQKKSGKKKYTISDDDKSYQIELKNASSGVQTSSSLVAITQYMAEDFSFKDAFRRATFDYLFEADRLTNFKPNIEMGDMPKWVHLHIEELELSLYPDAQRKLTDMLVKDCFMNHSSDRQLSLMIATHSPYIINHLNVLLRRKKYEPGAIGIDADQLAVYRIKDGTLQNLMAKNLQTGEDVVNTIDLSETMSDIYNEYTDLQARNK